jgi:predicted O-methyltransferase YrrM
MNLLHKLARLSARLLRIGACNPSRLRHVFGAALAAAEEVSDPSLDLLSFQTVNPEDLLAERNLDQRVTLALFPRTHASISVLETVCLVLLLKKTPAASVFEFGTYKGVSITQLTLNLPEHARIFTLDLPEERTDIRLQITDPDERDIALEGGKGALVPDELKARIQFLEQDSALLDETPFIGQMDFVFVDGAHSADYVRNDSEKGWRMLRSGGIIAWHDCRVDDPEVVRYLLQSPFRPARISNTSLAFAVKA